MKIVTRYIFEKGRTAFFSADRWLALGAGVELTDAGNDLQAENYESNIR